MLTLAIILFVIWSVIFYALITAYGEDPAEEYNQKVREFNKRLKDRHDKATKVSVTGDITYG